MKSRCKMPDLQMELLEAARSAPEGAEAVGSNMLEADLVLHLDDCDSCQAAVEGLRRKASVWMADRPSESAIASAAARFEAAAPRPSAAPWPGPLSFAFVGAVAGLALVVGAQRLSARPTTAIAPSTAPGIDRALPAPTSSPAADPREPSATAHADHPFPVAPAAPHVEGPHGVIPLADGLRLELKEGESARVALANGQSSDLRGPCSIQFWASSSEVGGWRLSPAEPTSSGIAFADPDKRPATETPSRGAPAASHETPLATSLGATERPKFERAWERAVEALRRDDFTAADQAFDELRRSPDGATRDAARLARAQLWIAHGWGTAVRPVLEDLAATGATALVRQRAAEFLSREHH
jgi:hypothetical protein